MQVVLLFIRRIFLRSKIKKLTRSKTFKEAKEKAKGKKLSKKQVATNKAKKLIFADKLNTATMWVLIAAALISVILCIMAIWYGMQLIFGITGFSILDKEEIVQEEEEKEYGWEWDEPDNGNGTPSISGGIYPVDPILKNRALLMEIITIACEDAEAEFNVNMDPGYLIGVIIRETGGYKLVNAIDRNKDTSWLTSLTFDNPVCEQGSSCAYIRNGYSHFVGGSVVNGKDTGDPYTMRINTDMNLYNANGKNHAVGFVQFEIPYVYGNRLDKGFPLEKLSISEPTISGFTRPHFFYLPDQLYAKARLIGGYNLSGPIYNQIVNDPAYQSLSDRNKNFILFMLQQSIYGSGQIRDSCLTAYKSLIAAHKNGKIKNFDEMLLPMKDKFYNSKTHVFTNYIPANAYNFIRSTYGVDAGVNSAVAWYGIFSACTGRVVWDTMQEYVDAAEKEGGGTTGGLAAGGQWLDYVGSGKFKPTSSGKYYDQTLQTTLYHQWAGSDNHSEYSWGAIRDGDGSTMSGAGCGVYCTAYCITNLTGEVVTVKDLVDNKLITYWPAVEYQIMAAAKHYGLDAYTVSAKEKIKDDKTFEDWVISELKDGGLIIQVYWGANNFVSMGASVPGYKVSDYRNDPFEWFNGEAHYMTIRGFNSSNNYLRVFSSVGANGNSFTTVSGIELPASRVRKYVNTYYTTNYNFIVIKPKGGIGSIAPPNDSTGNGGSGTTGGSSSYIWPVDSDWYRLSSLYGGRIHPITGKPNDHSGIDIPANGGEPIYAIQDGVVDTATSKPDGYGTYVKLKHPDGKYSLYAHMSKLNTKTGASVKQGDIIGYVGTTGSSTGNHLHFEIRNSSDYNSTVDPINYYKNLPLYVTDGSGKKVYL